MSDVSFEAKRCELLLRGSDRSFFSGLLYRSDGSLFRDFFDRNSLNDRGLRGSGLRCEFRLRLGSGLGLRSEGLRLSKRLLRRVAGLLGLSKRLLSAIRRLGRTKRRLRRKSRLRG